MEAEAKSMFLEEETTRSEHNFLRGNPNQTSVLNTYLPSRALDRADVCAAACVARRHGVVLSLIHI